MEESEKIDLRKYTYEQLCLIWRQVIHLRKQGCTIAEVYKFTGLSKRRISEIWLQYVATGKTPKPKFRGRKTGEKRALSPEQEKEIKRLIVDKNPNQLKFARFLWTANAVRELIKQRFGIELGKETMREYLLSWGMTSQRPAKRASKQNEIMVKVFKKEAYPAIKALAKRENAEIYYGDETGINNQAYNPRGYAPKGQTPVVPVETSRETVNMLSAITESGQHKFMCYDDSTTQQTLIEFMQNLIFDKKKSKVFLLLDNLKVHHGKLVQAFLEEHKDEIRVFYFPPYSPEINPQEYLNNVLKQHIHSGMPPRNKREIFQKVLDFAKAIGSSLIQNLFHHPKLDYVKNC
jgi:transposase